MGVGLLDAWKAGSLKMLKAFQFRNSGKAVACTAL
jgi:hypothetical protein